MSKVERLRRGAVPSKIFDFHHHHHYHLKYDGLYDLLHSFELLQLFPGSNEIVGDNGCFNHWIHSSFSQNSLSNILNLAFSVPNAHSTFFFSGTRESVIKYTSFVSQHSSSVRYHYVYFQRKDFVWYKVAGKCFTAANQWQWWSLCSVNAGVRNSVTFLRTLGPTNNKNKYQSYACNRPWRPTGLWQRTLEQ
jgi:hypothetical protein